MKIPTVVAVAVALVPSILAVSHTTDASACGMSVRMEPTPQKPTPVQQIARAEKALEDGRNDVAAKVVLATFPRVRGATPGANPLETRALRVFALAVARSNGAVGAKSSGVEWTPAANLEWAVQSMREVDAKRPNDPTVLADLGEALSKLPHRQNEAIAILQKLAEKDLMGSPHAYAALAKLRTERGDSAGAQAAIKRCEEMSRSPGICRPATPSAPAAFAAAKA